MLQIVKIDRVLLKKYIAAGKTLPSIIKIVEQLQIQIQLRRGKYEA